MCPTFLSIWVYCRLSLLEHRLFPQDFIRKHSDLDSDYPWVTQFKVRIHPSFAIFIDRSQLLDPFGPIWEYCLRVFTKYGYGSIPINTIFRGMNIHLPAILMSTKGIGFWPIPIYRHIQNKTYHKLYNKPGWIVTTSLRCSHRSWLRLKTGESSSNGQTVQIGQLWNNSARYT